MKTLLLPIVLIGLMSFSSSDSKLSEDDRKLMLTELQMAHDHLMIAVHGLSEAQLNYKMDENSWSIADCVEHITITEDGFTMMITGMMQKEPETAEPVEVTDQGLIAMMKDRSNKVKTSEAFEPSGKYGSYEETLAAFKEKRAKLIDLVKTTDFDLRSGRAQLPFGVVDGVQLVTAVGAHSERHVRQIEEIIVSEGFPKE